MIDPVFLPFLAATAGAVVTFVVKSDRSARRLRASWREAVRVCGLRQAKTSGWFGFVATARSTWFAVRVERVARRMSGLGLQVRVHTVTDRIGLLMPEHVAPGQTVTSREDIVVGEPRLDDRMIISGEPLAVRALLDRDTRDLLLSLVVGSTDPLRPCPRVRLLRMSGGTLSIVMGFEHLAGTLHTLLKLAERLADVPPVEAGVAAVAAVAAGDPLPSVRIASLNALMEERPRHPVTRTALRTALADPSERVRLTAALTLRTEGREALLGIVHNPDSADEVAARAIAALGAHLPAGDAEHALEHAVRTERYDTIGACLDSLAARGAPGLPPIRRVLDGASDTCAALAASALGLSGSAEVEPLLLRALEHDSLEVRASAARALGRVGTAASVPALRTAAEGGDAAFGSIVRVSVASIQSRLTGAEQGQLALASDGGAVSLADDASGRISLPHRVSRPTGP